MIRIRLPKCFLGLGRHFASVAGIYRGGYVLGTLMDG